MEILWFHPGRFDSTRIGRRPLNILAILANARCRQLNLFSISTFGAPNNRHFEKKCTITPTEIKYEILQVDYATTFSSVPYLFNLPYLSGDSKKKSEKTVKVMKYFYMDNNVDFTYKCHIGKASKF